MKSPFEGVVEKELMADGWTVFNTNDGFPDLFCIKGGVLRLIECKRKTDVLRDNQDQMIKRLRAAGIQAEVRTEEEQTISTPQTVAITTGNRVTIPHQILSKMGLKEGDWVVLEMQGETIVVTPADIKPRETPLDKLEQAEHD